MPRTALFPGSFDPVTNGHLDLVRQAARFADRLVLAIGTHPGKTTLFTRRERARHAGGDLRTACARRRMRFCAASPLPISVVTAAQREGATLLVRGLRSATDFDYEMEMAGMNARHGPGGTDDFSAGLAACPPDHRHTGAPDRIHGRRRVEFVPPAVAARLKAKFGRKPGA